MRLTITLNDPQHPLHGQLLLDVTDDTGISGTVGAELDLGGVVPLVTPGDDRLEVLWEFDDPTVGSGTCLTLVDIQVRPS